MTIRFRDDAWEELETIARVTGQSMSVVVREAIAAYIAAEIAEPEVRAEIRALAEANRRRLRDSGPDASAP